VTSSSTTRHIIRNGSGSGLLFATALGLTLSIYASWAPADRCVRIEPELHGRILNHERLDKADVAKHAPSIRTFASRARGQAATTLVGPTLAPWCHAARFENAQRLQPAATAGALCDRRPTHLLPRSNCSDPDDDVASA